MKIGQLRQLARSLAGAPAEEVQRLLQEQVRRLGLDPGSLYQELEMTSPLVDTHRDVSWSNAHLQLHSHTFYELLYCCGSAGVEYLVGSERYRLQRGDIIFVPPGVSHRPLLPERLEVPYERYVLWLSEGFLRQYAQLLPWHGDAQAQVGLLRTGGTRWEHLGELFRAGVQESEEQRIGWEAAVVGNTICLLTQIRRATQERTVGTLQAERPELTDALTAYVERHYAEHITIAQLAQRFYVSESTVSHLFKQRLGTSFYSYVTQRRLIAAKTMILQGLPLEEVAGHAGFGDYSGFYRAFRKEYGISPRQYKQMQEKSGGKP